MIPVSPATSPSPLAASFIFAAGWFLPLGLGLHLVEARSSQSCCSRSACAWACCCKAPPYLAALAAVRGLLLCWLDRRWAYRCGC